MGFENIEFFEYYPGCKNTSFIYNFEEKANKPGFM